MKKTNKISYIQTSKINFLSILLLLFVVTTKAQTPYNQYLTPNGVLENVFDQNGNRYQLRDLIVSNQIDLASNKSVLVSCSSTSIFNLYFEPGCGMTSTTNLTEINRRTVLCQVFQDISNFINTPLTTTNKKVNIWVRNINNITGVNMNATLGLASGFYLLPPSNLNSASVQGGIADNELWKTIHTGQDSYTNVAPPLIINSPNNNDSGAYYHGMVALNFNTTASNVPLFNWYTTPLTAVALVGSNDLYSVILHEVTHALGFGSLIDQNGNSRFEPNFKFYSRYDKFLKNNANTQFLLPNTVGTSSMYNTTFNSNTAAITPAVIRPSCATSGFINTGNPVDMTTCTSALRFVSSTLNVPVYTPICYERGSSLSHFEDQCVAPNVNNAYFVMSNAAGSGANNTKRYLKPQERSALCDLGYSVKPTFGSSAVRLTATALGPFNYGGTGSCLGITVAGTNDGITYTAATNTSTYTYIGVINTSISIPCSGLLANDTNATGLEYLEDLTTGTVLLTSGTNTSIATLYTGILGVHLLRYVPTNGTQKGNITYVYVYLTSDASCTSANACNLVLNGGFEQFSSLPTNLAQISNACGWNSATGTVDYFNTNATNLSYVQIPCNFSGNQASNNSIGNGYAGLYARLNQNNNPNSNYSEVIYTRLASPLVAGVKYQLRFDVALSDGYSSARPILQAYFSSADLFSINPVLNLPSGAMPISDLTYHNNFAGWDTITLTYTATGGEIFLYIGTINNFTTQTTSLVIPNPG